MNGVNGMKDFEVKHPRLPRSIAAGLFASLLCCLPATTGYVEMLVGATDGGASASTNVRGQVSSIGRFMVSGTVSVANAVRRLLRAEQKRRRWWRRATQTGSHEQIHTQPALRGGARPEPVRLPVHWVDPPSCFRVLPHYRRVSSCVV